MMKRLGMWILLVGISFILAACLDKSKSQVSPYEFSLLQDFAQTSKLPMPQIEETSFEWQEGEEKLTVQGWGFSLSGLQENPDEAVETFFRVWTKNEENSLGRGSVNIMGFEKDGTICLSESHIHASLQQINDDAHFPQHVPYSLRLTCGQKRDLQITTKQKEKKTENTINLCLAEIEKQIFASPQFIGVKQDYDKALAAPNQGDREQFLGYYLELEGIDDESYKLALAENYPSRVLKYHRFQVDKKTGEIRLYNITSDTYDEIIPHDERYPEFFAQHCKNLDEYEA
ncbi:MAG: hypothetical protein ACFN4U_02130 [Candidatus Absconditicoccaceae bacterium]